MTWKLLQSEDYYRHYDLCLCLTRWSPEFFFKAEYARDMGMPQWMARIDHLFAVFHLERIWLGRHKPFHFRVWYRDHLHGYMRQMLLDKRSLARPYVTRATVERVVNDHLRGNRNYTTDPQIAGSLN